jgi:hypothetical protein
MAAKGAEATATGGYVVLREAEAGHWVVVGRRPFLNLARVPRAGQLISPQLTRYDSRVRRIGSRITDAG